LQFEEAEQVIIFLNIEHDSIYGSHYYVSGVESGYYSLTGDGAATNEDATKNLTETELTDRIDTTASTLKENPTASVPEEEDK